MIDYYDLYTMCSHGNSCYAFIGFLHYKRFYEMLSVHAEKYDHSNIAAWLVRKDYANSCKKGSQVAGLMRIVG